MMHPFIHRRTIAFDRLHKRTRKEGPHMSREEKRREEEKGRGLQSSSSKTIFRGRKEANMSSELTEHVLQPSASCSPNRLSDRRTPRDPDVLQWPLPLSPSKLSGHRRSRAPMLSTFAVPWRDLR
jgi:hypothetical protein